MCPVEIPLRSLLLMSKSFSLKLETYWDLCNSEQLPLEVIVLL